MEAVQTMPMGSKINFRMLFFAGIIFFLLGWPAYTFINDMLHHGIVDRGSYLEVDLKSLGFFDLDPYHATIASVPEHYRKLDGKRVLLKGEIYRADASYGKLTDFTFVYSIAKCCFGGPPKVQERVFATVNKDAKVDYDGGVLYEVVGRLSITMKRDPTTNQITEVYHLDVEQVATAK